MTGRPYCLAPGIIVQADRLWKLWDHLEEALRFGAIPKESQPTLGVLDLFDGRNMEQAYGFGQAMTSLNQGT